MLALDTVTSLARSRLIGRGLRNAPMKTKIRAGSMLSDSMASRAHVRPSVAMRSYAIKPLLVDNEFPKFDKPVPHPTEIKFKKSERNLYVSWEDGCTVKLPAEYLRVESPSAEVQGHGGANEKRLIFGRKHVNIMSIEPQGHYGVLIKFDDMHDSGIYSWDYLRYLGKNKFSIMKRYILNLRKAGKSRDPRQNVPKAPPKKT